MSEVDVKNLLVSGSLDSFLDALDFAPIGVIDLIKTLAVSLPLTDLNKRRVLKEKTGFDVDKALVHIEEEKTDEIAGSTGTLSSTSGRRVKISNDNNATTSERRTTPKYNVVKEETV